MNDFRRWLRGLGRALPIAGAVVMALVVLLFAWGLVTGGGHEPAPYTRTSIERISVCPSAAHHVETLIVAAERWGEHGCPVLTIALDDCDGFPSPGEMQMRDCRDALALGEGTTCDDEHQDLVSVSEGVAYVIPTASLGVLAHAYGHTIGQGHTTAARSIMAPVPGSEWHMVECDDG